MKSLKKTVGLVSILVVGIVSQIAFGQEGIEAVEPVSGGIALSPSYNGSGLEDVATGQGAFEFMRTVSIQALTGKRLSPSYDGDDAINAAGPGPSEAPSLALSPSYAGDILATTAVDNGQFEFMREVSEQALTGRRLSPSYDGDDGIIAAGPNAEAVTALALSPSYADGIQATAGNGNGQFEFMQVVSEQALNGQRLSPSYDGDDIIIGAAPEADAALALSPSYTGDSLMTTARNYLLEFMQKVSVLSLDGKRISPSYNE